LESVVETVGRASPALVATWLAVIASPPARAASTEALVSPRAVRPPLFDVGSLPCRVLAVGVAETFGSELATRARCRGAVATRAGRTAADYEAGCPVDYKVKTTPLSEAKAERDFQPSV
jgi:hypothetical protein